MQRCSVVAALVLVVEVVVICRFWDKFHPYMLLRRSKGNIQVSLPGRFPIFPLFVTQFCIDTLRLVADYGGWHKWAKKQASKQVAKKGRQR